jgi:RNA polymerase sigma-70 factor, ECF subfamily
LVFVAASHPFVDAVSEARTAWGIEVTPERLQAYAERVAPVTSQVRLTDLCLTCACVDGDVTAIAVFDRELRAAVESAVRRVGGGRVDHDEVIQRLRARLVVGDGAGPAPISEYSGRGPLLGWLRVIATREILTMRRREKFEEPVDDASLFALPAPEADPQLAFLNRHYRAAFRAAFQHAFAALEPVARDMLRAHYLDGLTFDLLAERHQIHRATVARWIARARDTLLKSTRDQLSRTLAVGREELDSILNAVGSHLEVSLGSQIEPDPV